MAVSRTVFVDVSPLAERRITGIGRYTARLALGLARQKGCAVRFVAQDQEVIAPRGLDLSQDQDLARWSRRVWRGRRVALSEANVPADTIAVYCCLREPKRRFPFEISVLHDFTPLVVPFTHTAKSRTQFARFFAHDLRWSDAAIADSHATRSDALWLCDFPHGRIAVAPLGPSLCIGRHLDESPIARRPDVGLVVSTLEPRKNALFLLDWFAHSDTLQERAELWWVGPVGWLTSRRRLQGYRRLRGRRVRFLGVVSDATLCRLYRTVGWSAYPSLYEGFGLPVLDALRHGTPVLASYHSALVELDYLGVHFFDPYDTATVDDAWRALCSAGPVVAPRATLDELHSWDAVARTVLSLPLAREHPSERAA
jgi:glycosyltransferase involved in cell wall biosynthesis